MEDLATRYHWNPHVGVDEDRQVTVVGLDVSSITYEKVNYAICKPCSAHKTHVVDSENNEVDVSLSHPQVTQVTEVTRKLV